MVGLPVSKKAVMRTGDVGEESRSKCREERRERRREEKGRDRFRVGFLRLLTTAGDAAPGTCMAPTPFVPHARALTRRTRTGTTRTDTTRRGLHSGEGLGRVP